MLTASRAFFLVGLLTALPAWAVYAPVPEQEQGKDLTLSARGGISYDSNLFGAATNEVDSLIYSFAPRAVYNRSLSAQTFFSSSYGLTLDYFEDRPGDKLLDSHDLTARLAHQFSKSTILDVNEQFSIMRNPESLLAGIPLNPDQSVRRNQLDGRFITPLHPKATATVKARSVYYNYRDATLGRSLDRIENLFGVAGDYAALPQAKLVGEYRHQDVYYRKEGEIKNKRSEYLMGGVDYDVARKMSLSARVGAEWRRRAADRDVTAPYAEMSGRYSYTETSFLVGGYAYTLEETSDVLRFNDSQLHRFFVSAQHAFTPLIVGSGSITYEPAKLRGRRGNSDVPEDTIRTGAAVSYLPTKNWTLSASYDYDRVYSGLAARDMTRSRCGVNAIYTF